MSNEKMSSSKIPGPENCYYQEHVNLLVESFYRCTGYPLISSAKHDSKHAPLINKGSVIKVNANQRYASNSTTISRFMNVANSLKESYQEFVTRSDMGCGSTIGPITATRLGIETLDVGLPTFAMHSIRELCGRDDAHSLYKIILGFSK